MSLLLTATLALSTAPGCGTTPPAATAAALHDAEFSTGYPIEPGNARALGYDVRWVHDIAIAPGQEITRVVKTDGPILTIESPINMVTALNPATGALLWKDVVGSRLEDLQGGAADEKNVYLNTTSRLYTLSRRTGEIRSIADLKYPVSGSPLLLGRLAVFGSEVGNVYAHHLDDGYTRWAYGLTAAVRATPLVDGLHVFAVDSAGHYAMLNSASGRLLWRGEVYGGVTADPLLHNGFLIVASEDQSLYSLTTANGKDRWPAFRSEARLTETPVAREDLIFVNEPGRGLSAIAADTGERRWHFAGDLKPRFADGSRLLAQGIKALVSLDHATGAVETSVPTHLIQDLIAGDDGSLLLLTAQGTLMQLDPTHPVPPPAAPEADAATDDDPAAN